jgi:hypothetical protein
MSLEDIQIVTLALNNIKLDEQVQVDRRKNPDDLQKERDDGFVVEKNIGLYVPFITINGYSVTKYLKKFDLNLDGFLPIVKFTFYALESVFISVNYPKDGDIASVYMRSPGDYYKPFRMDFSILSVNSEPSSVMDPSGKDAEGRGKNLKFTIMGECRIPGLYTNRIKSFRDVTSSECLLQVSQDLNLGFSTNDRTLNDKMTWICPSYSYYDFIQEVSLRAYKDDEKSFFDCWIDCYYNLNFVNLGSQFDYGDPPQQIAVYLPGYVGGGYQASNEYAATPDPGPVQGPLVLTNLSGYGTIPYFIIGYTLTSRSGLNTNQMGYVNQIGFYDEHAKEKNLSNKYIKYDIESQTPEKIGIDAILQKGRARDNSYKEEKRIEWLGVLNSKISPSDGVHPNFIHAKFQNLININDATKMTLVVELENYFPGIYRGQVVPVQIYVSETGLRQQNAGNQSNRETNDIPSPVQDLFLSGNYVVIGVSVYWSYSGGRMRQSLTLAKRVWNANSSGALPKAFPISPTRDLF